MPPKTPDFPPGVALVTGGSGGVGRAICIALAQAGADVALTYRGNRQAAQQTLASLEALGAKASIHALDLTQGDQIHALINELTRDGRPLHTVVNATGANIPMRYISQIEPALWQDVINNDLNGFFQLLHASLPHLRQSQGSLVAVTSIGLRRWPKRDVLSVVPKAGIEALLRGVAREEGRFGVRANSVQLGVIESGIFLRLSGSDFNEEWIAAARENTALKRFGTAEDVAGAVVFLASQRAAYITGQAIRMDGGFSL